MATAVGPLTIDLYLPALPQIASDFAASAPAVQLSLTAAVIGVALGQLVAGPIADRLGRRPVILAAMVMFVVLSAVCAVAPTLPLFIGARFGQGLLAGAVMVVTRAVLRDYVSGAALSRAFAGLMLVVGAGPILAPALGSLLLAVTGWRGVFAALAAMAVMTAVALVVWLPESLPRRDRVAVSLTSLRRTYAAVLADRAFVLPTLVSATAFAAMFAYISSGSFVLQQGYGLSQFWFGVVFGTTATCVILGTQLSPRLMERFGDVTVLRAAPIGGLGAAVALAVVSWAGWATLPVLIGLVMVMFLGIGVAIPAGTSLALTSQPPQRAGLASGLLGVTQFVVGGIAAPIVGLFDARSATVMALVMAASLATSAAIARLARLPATSSRAGNGDGAEVRTA